MGPGVACLGAKAARTQGIPICPGPGRGLGLGLSSRSLSPFGISTVCYCLFWLPSFGFTFYLYVQATPIRHSLLFCIIFSYFSHPGSQPAKPSGERACVCMIYDHTFIVLTIEWYFYVYTPPNALRFWPGASALWSMAPPLGFGGRVGVDLCGVLKWHCLHCRIVDRAQP